MDVSVNVVVVVITALIFDFTNGFHDTANAMATSIATGALRPRVAVAVAGVLNLAGAFLSVQVAKTISGGLVDEVRITPAVIFAGLVGAILWNLLTWLLGLPSSSSHALFGGLIGATLAAAGPGAVHFTAVLGKVVLPALVSPLLAGVVAFAATRAAYRLTARARGAKVNRAFKFGQVVSASTVALAHGTNDAQKTMGVITLTLITAGLLVPGSAPPFWVVLAAGLAIALGTYLGGWRIIRTLGKRVSDIETTQGFTAESTSGAIILASTHLGLPLSTTQVCTGAIFGARCRASVRLGALGCRRPAGTGLDGHPAGGGHRRCTRILHRDHRHRRSLGRRARWSGPLGGYLRRVAPRPGDRAQRERCSRASAGPDPRLSSTPASTSVEHTRAHEGTLRLAVGQRLRPPWTSEAHAFSHSVATAIPHPGRCPAERQSWQPDQSEELSRHLVQSQSSSMRTAADEAGRRMRPAIIIAWTPPRVSSTSGSCGPIRTAPSTWCAPVTALDGSDVTSGWGVAAHP
jgi:inorganic phosphate transporter, PiT family